MSSINQSTRKEQMPDISGKSAEAQDLMAKMRTAFIEALGKYLSGQTPNTTDSELFSVEVAEDQVRRNGGPQTRAIFTFNNSEVFDRMCGEGAFTPAVLLPHLDVKSRIVDIFNQSASSRAMVRLTLSPEELERLRGGEE
jgi:hypothetical protein